MTKNKTKKMTKSTFVIIIMAIAMVAMLAFGGTYAYFTATTAKVASGNTATTGTVQLGTNSVSNIKATGVVSGDDILKGADGTGTGKVTIVNKSNVATYIFVTFDATFKEDGATETTNPVASKDLVKNDGEFFLDYAVTNGTANTLATESATAADEDTWYKLSGKTNVYFMKATATTTDKSYDVCKSIIFYGKSESNGATAGSLMNGTITVSLESKSIQVIKEDGNGTTLTPAEAYDVLYPSTPAST